MDLIKTEDAVGHILCHDITQIIKNVKKGVAFQKGHVIQAEDIPVLLSLGKEHLYVWRYDETMLHENEAAKILYDLCANKYMSASEIHEGKIEIIATVDGFFEVDTERLNHVNMLGEMMIATRRTNSPIKKGDVLAGMRIIPLIIEKTKMEQVKKWQKEGPLLKITPYQKQKVAIIATGSEIFKGRIKDTFTSTLIEKLADYPAEVITHKIQDDQPQLITADIIDALQQGADIVLCTGGMSVDPDDLTPLAIKKTGAHIVSYGAPVLPGAMFLLAYQNNKVIMGLPGCVMYSQKTIFDIIFPRIMARIAVTKEDLSKLGNGGLCLRCATCIYPNCAFGSGI